MRPFIDDIKTGTFCLILLASGHTINAYKDEKRSTTGPGGWFAYFYETNATGRGRLRNWRIAGNSIVALSVTE